MARLTLVMDTGDLGRLYDGIRRLVVSLKLLCYRRCFIVIATLIVCCARVLISTALGLSTTLLFNRRAVVQGGPVNFSSQVQSVTFVLPVSLSADFPSDELRHAKVLCLHLWTEDSFEDDASSTTQYQDECWCARSKLGLLFYSNV